MPRRSSKVRCICQICNREFERWPSLIKQGQGKHCSPKCSGLAKRKRTVCTCPVCGLTFEEAVFKVLDGRKYCSPACRSVGRKRPRERTWEKGIKRFWKKVVKADGCWRWTGYTINHGYGLFTIGRRYILAHRLSWQLHYGNPPPVDKFVCHSCDNPNCVNPDHLFLGTAKDNATDMVGKGRQCRGIQHPRAKLTEEQVREMKQLFALGMTSREVAELYGIRTQTVHAVKVGDTWKHISPE